MNAQLIDISKWNGPSDLKIPATKNFEKAKLMGIDGVIIRLGSIDGKTGVCYEDFRLIEYVDAAVKHNMPIGYYFYARPGNSGRAQGNFMVKTLKNLPLNLDVWIDMEEIGPSPSVSRANIKDIINILQTNGYNNKVGIYTRQSIWDSSVAQDNIFGTLKLWAARWSPGLTSPWSDGLFAFRDWKNWTMWQYSADGNRLGAAYGFDNGDADMDLNYFNGNDSDFVGAYGLGTQKTIEQRVKSLEERVSALESRLLRTPQESGKVAMSNTDLIIDDNF